MAILLSVPRHLAVGAFAAMASLLVLAGCVGVPYEDYSGYQASPGYPAYYGAPVYSRPSVVVVREPVYRVYGGYDHPHHHSRHHW